MLARIDGWNEGTMLASVLKRRRQQCNALESYARSWVNEI